MELNGLNTEFLGRNFLFFKTIDSTQTKLKSLKPIIIGTTVCTDNQTEGLGTHDRKWYTGIGKNIAFSFVLTPDCNIENIKNITVIIAEVLINVLKKLYNIQLEIKEPNDIYYKGKKVAGILTETVCKGEKVRAIYVGIGINVNQEVFPGNLNEIATSLKREFDMEFDRERIIVEFLNWFEDEYKGMIGKECDI